MLAAVNINTLLLALMPAFTMVAVSVGVIMVNRKAHLGPALDYADRANEILEKEVKELKNENIRLLTENEALKTRTDVAAAIKPLEQRLVSHDQAMQSMMDKHLDLIKLIADELASLHTELHAGN